VRAITFPRTRSIPGPLAALAVVVSLVLIGGSFLVGWTVSASAAKRTVATGAARIRTTSTVPVSDRVLTRSFLHESGAGTSARDLYNAGITLQRQGRCADAMPYFNSAIARNTVYVNALRGRAQCAETLGADDVAIADLTTALRADPRNYGLFLNRTDAETDNGSTGRAQADALAALRLVPAQAPAYDSVAQALYNVADLADAVATINLALQVLPSDPSQYVLRAKYRAAMFDYRGAEADYSRAISLSLPHDQVDLYRKLADVQDQMQDYPSARGSIASAIARQSHDPGLYLDAATIEQDAGNDAGALRRYTQALAHGAKGDEALQAREGQGDMMAALHRKTAAIRAYRSALSLTRDRGRRAEIRAKVKALSH